MRGRALGAAMHDCEILERKGTPLVLVASQAARERLGPRAEVSIRDGGVVDLPGVDAGSLTYYLVTRAGS